MMVRVELTGLSSQIVCEVTKPIRPTPKYSKPVHRMVLPEQNQDQLPKTVILFSKWSESDGITITTNGEQITLSPKSEMRYLGATFIANKASNSSCILINLKPVDADIHRRCQILHSARLKYKIFTQTLQDLRQAMIGGKLTYSEKSPNIKTLRPLRIAYNNFMRT